MSAKQLPVLGANASDRITATLRGIAGAVPVVGSALAEIVTEIVPNQRIERVEKYLLFLAEEIAARSIENISERMKAPENVDLIEEGAYQAVRGISDERKRYLARAVAQGIETEEREKIKERRILKIIGELDDGDVLILDAFGTNVPGAFAKFDKIRPEHPTLNSPSDVRERYQFYMAAIDRLERLSLLDNVVQLDTKTGLPDYDRFTGAPKGTHRITTLGQLILKRIGLKP